MGSGSLAAMSIFEASFKEDMTKEEAMALVARAIRSGQSPHLVPELLWCPFCAEHFLLPCKVYPFAHMLHLLFPFASFFGITLEGW